MPSIISSHNRKLLQEKTTSATPPTLCYCKKNTTNSLNGECYSKSVVYKAGQTCDNITKYYYGICKTAFKTRCNNHKHTFRHQDKRHLTELSKAYWNSIETGKHPNLKWNRKKRAQSYQNGTNRCNFCLEEKNCNLTSKPG